MRIPLAEGLGRAVAEAPLAPRPQQGDGGVGAAAQRLGATITHAAYSEADRQAHEEAVEKRQRLHDILEQNRTREAADRAHASARVGENRDALDALHSQFVDDIQTGQLDKTKAIELWRKRAEELVASGSKDAPDAFVGTIQADAKRRAAQLEGKVLRAVTARDRSDIVAGIDQTLEYAQRLATTDPAKGMQVGVEALEQLGPHAGLAPDVIAKKRQGFLEGVAYTRAYTAIYTAKTDNKSLRAADAVIAKDETLDPQKKATLLATSAGFQAANEQRAEAAAARAERRAEAHLKRAEAEFNVFQSLADKGGALSPEYVAAAAAKTAGTPYQAGIKALAEQAATTGGIAVQPIARQRAELQAIDTQIQRSGRSPELDRRRSAIEKVLRSAEQDIKTDPMRAALERGVVGELAPLDMSSPAALAASAGKRLEQSQQVSVWAGEAVSPLTSDEALTLQSGLSKLPPRERSQAVAALASAMGPQQAAGLARQIDPKDKALALALASGATSTSAGRYTSELILRGAQAQKDGTSTKNEKTPGVKAGQWKSNIAEQLRDVFPAQTVTDNAVEAALFIAHGMASEKGGDLSKRDLELAVGLAVGGKVEELNGRRIALPAGIELDAIERRLKTVTAEEIERQTGGATVRAGGVDVPAAEFAKRLPGAELMFAGRGRYMVLVGGRPALGANGKPVTIGVQ